MNSIFSFENRESLITMTTIEVDETVRNRIKEIERLRKKPVIPLSENGDPLPVPLLPPVKRHPEHEILQLADDGCPHVDEK